MAGKKGPGENSKKAQGQARKAEQAASKAAAEETKKAKAEEAEWDKGAKKGNAKKESAEEKKAEAARKKAERDALLAEEEANTPGRSAPKNAKSAQKKTKGIDAALGGLEGKQGDDDKPLAALNASNIDDAFEALGLATGASKGTKIDRRPEQRVQAAFKAWKEKTGREKELQESGIRHSARQQKLWDEFKDSPDHPKNQATAAYNATREELKEIRAAEDEKLERRLGSK